MKNLIFTTIFFLASTFTLLAQAPQSFKYQGVARDNGTVVIGNIGLQISIRSGSPTGTIEYQEDQFPSTNSYGVFSIDVGGSDAIVTQGDFASIDWSTGDFFIQVAIDPAGGTSFTDMGTSSLISVPYALYAESAQTAITAGSATNDFDTDPNNENQDLSINGADLSISNGNSVTLPIRSSIADADGDSKIQVEEGADDDVIRFDVGGQEFIKMDGRTLEIFSNSGNHNTFVGREAGKVTTGNNNTFIGTRAGVSNSTGENNTILGWDAGFFTTTGSNNTFLGRQSGTSTQVGNQNTYVGGLAGRFSMGSGNVFLGYSAGFSEGGDNKLYIDNSDTGSPLIYGEFDNDIIRINGNLGFGLNAPAESIHVSGGNIRVDGGQFQSNGHLVLRPDSDQSGDDLINFLASDGSSRAHIDGFGLSVNGAIFVNHAYSNVDVNVRGKADHPVVFRTETTTGSSLFEVFENGNVAVTNNLSKGGGSFKIDHPLDPENKYLYHSFVESPDMMNVYNGNITTDTDGMAIVELPEYFMTLNKDFRYQLTVMGTFAQAIIKEKMANNTFVIQTNEPNVEVSWQVTGIRQDAYANKNRIPNEVDKEEEEKGFYLHPEAFGQPASKGIRIQERSKTAEQ